MSETETALSYSRALHVRMPDPASNEGLMKLARDRAPDPGVFDQFNAYFFHGEMSSNRWDAYDTRMMPSSLKNYSAESADGVSFLRGHDTRRDPIGQTLQGNFVGGNGNGVARAETAYYVLSDPDSETFVNRMRAGAIRDLSIGFYGGQWICSICGRDMQDWMSRDGCPHLLGMTYTPADEAGQERGKPQKARASIEDAHLAELSGVYDGATPGAMIAKARALDEEGLLTARQRELVEVRYRLHLPSHRLIVPGADLKEKKMDRDNPSTPAGTVETDGIRLADGVLVTPQDVAQERQRGVDLRKALTAAGVPEGKSLVEGVRHLAEQAARVVGLEDEVRGLKDEQSKNASTLDDGKKYRQALIADALAEGVRAVGNGFATETYTNLLQGASIETIERMRDDWKAQAAQVLPGGRRTADAGDKPALNDQDQVPDAAFRTRF